MWTDGGRGPKLVSILRQRSWDWPVRAVITRKTAAIGRDMGLLEGRFLTNPFPSPVACDYVALAMIRGSNERTAFDIIKAHLVPCFLQFGEFVGMDESNDGEVFFCRLQVLA